MNMRIYEALSSTRMKSLPIFLFLLLAGSPAYSPRGEKIVKIVLEYHSYMCEGFCTYIFEVNKHTKSITRIPGTITRPKPGETVKDREALVEILSVSQDEWAEILSSFSLEEITAMPALAGCPGCDDGSEGYLKISTEHRMYTLAFEGPNPPDSITELTRLITAEAFLE